MKKKKYILLIPALILIFNILNVNASINTIERTEDNLLVPSYITVTDNNKQTILSTPAVDATEKIYDYADLYTDNEEKKLYDEVTAYTNEQNQDLAIVTIDSNNRGSAQQYAQDFYDYNEFGIGSTHDGLLLLIDMDTREIFMTTTGSAINLYNDYRIDKILDSIYQFMTDKDYYNGTHQFINVIDSFAKLGMPSSDDEKLSISSDGSLKKTIPWVIIILIPLGVTAIVIAILISKNKMVRKATTAREYLNKGSVDIQTLGEHLISTNTVRTEIVHNDSSGGSSTFSGSSGISHGGGGHGF